MNFSKLSAIGACCALMVSCSSDKKVSGLFDPIDYTLTVSNIQESDSTYAYLYDFDAMPIEWNNDYSQGLIDSALIVDGQITFDIKGASTPILALRIGQHYYTIFPEAGENTYDLLTNEGSGKVAKINKANSESYKATIDSILAYMPEEEGPERNACISAIYDLNSKIFKEELSKNIDNALGLYLITTHYDFTLCELDSIIALQPQLADSKRVQTLVDNCKKLESTSAGHPYVDFEIEYNGITSKLSDYVKPGEYTLVDFWASWCGPCKHAIADLKENYESLKAKGLNIVGVGVWEDPEITEAWLAENPLPWPLILNAQRIPTDLYSIKGIPTLMLIGPDGNIVIRSYSEEEVLEAFNNAIVEENKQ